MKSLPPTYVELLGELRRLYELESIGGLLGWDEEVNLPDASGDQRAEQHAALAAAVHREATGSRISSLLATLSPTDPVLDADARAVVALAKKNHRESTALPEELVARKAKLGSDACRAWRKAREDNDFAAFAPWLERQVESTREIAAQLGYAANPYDWCIDRHDPGLDTAFVSGLFAELRAGLIPLSEEILKKRAHDHFVPAPRIEDSAGQLAFARAVTSRMGFDYGRGRLDRSTHPFCSGDAFDCRLTTRCHDDSPLDSLFGAVHEAGHGLYAQGLDRENLGNALGRDAGMGVHESQSRLWENQVARSAPFWRWAAPLFRAHLPERDTWHDAAELHRRANRVGRTLIRVESDEVTYNQHILLRFELEKRLFDGSLRVRDLPAAWREQTRELLGMEPATDTEGVLQDIHWSWGSFGYFPSYTLGNLFAAALWDSFRAAHPGWESEFERGDFTTLLAFLRTRVHASGRRLGLRELCLRATGTTLSPAPLLAHLRERYA